MKLKSSILLAIIILIACEYKAQNHLDYSYTLDALSYSIPGYEDEEHYFKAHLYPVFHSHNNDSVLDHLNGLFSEELLLPKSAQLKERLVAVKIDNLMSDRQVLEMLMARIGMLDKNPEKLDYQLDVRTDRIDFPNNRETQFNYRFKREISSQPKETVEENKFSVIDWTTGKAQVLGDYGSKKLLKCLQDASKEIDFDQDMCEDKTSLKLWLEELDCQTPLGAIGNEGLTFHIYSNEFPCEALNEFPIEVEAVNDCFENDKLCESDN